jgi:short subunit dehydrogenase-like uncharacterized protein
VSGDSWLIYGANGYTGSLIAEACRAAGLRPTLSGRDPRKVRPLAERLGMPWRCFPLNDAAGIVQNLVGHSLVLHCAGPFSGTSPQMVDACLHARVDYLDITGELPVLEAVYRRDAEARHRGILLVPGVGCDVVPSNCLAAELSDRLPGADRLELACTFSTRPSRGTLRSILEQLPLGGWVIRNGALTRTRHGRYVKAVNFSQRKTLAVAAPWGDLSAAFSATRIGNITVYMSFPRSVVFFAKLFGGLAPMLGAAWIQRLLSRIIDRCPDGPSSIERSRGRLSWWGEVSNGSRARLSGQVDIPDPYEFTVLAALAAVKRMLNGPKQSGALTPARAFGPDFLGEIPAARIVISSAPRNEASSTG